MLDKSLAPNSSTATQLRSFIEKLERLEEEKSELMETIRDVFAEAKGMGFDPKIMRQVLRLRKMKPEDFVEQEQLLDLYLNALGMDRPAQEMMDQLGE